jgi:hypothetical protein
MDNSTLTQHILELLYLLAEKDKRYINHYLGINLYSNLIINILNDENKEYINKLVQQMITNSGINVKTQYPEEYRRLKLLSSKLPYLKTL